MAILVGTALFAALAIFVIVLIYLRQRHPKVEKRAKQAIGGERRKCSVGNSQQGGEQERQEGSTRRTIEKSNPPPKVGQGPGTRTGEETTGPRGTPPGKRGGRPRGLMKPADADSSVRPRSRSWKPELVCWDEGWGWAVGIEVPEELKAQQVVQNEEPLEQDNPEEPRYRLNHATGLVKVICADGRKDIVETGGENNCLIFKMRKNWEGLGRLVRRTTTGYYLAITPHEWERDERISGPAPIAPQSVKLQGYRAHFFYHEKGKNGEIAFIATNDKRIKVKSGGPRFEFVGKEIPDASESMGPLFAGRPPRIRSLYEKGWTDVRMIVVGEEGRGRNRWRMAFEPRVGSEEQSMPDDLKNRGGGWYFVRIYNQNGDLLESLDFRFLTALRDIKISPHPCLPDQDGHRPITVDFCYEPGCEVELEKGLAGALRIEQQNTRTSAIIPASSAWDVTDWVLKSAGARVTVEILVKRVWWSLVREESEVARSERLDRPCRINRGAFRARSKYAIYLWFPKPRWVDEVLVGFSVSSRRRFRVKVTQRSVRIPLSDFSDTKEVNDLKQGAELKVWITAPNSTSDGVAICEISPKYKPPRVKKPTEPEGDPSQMRSCSTCDHARARNDTYWCRRYHWPRVTSWVFDEKFCRHLCDDWRGEYYDPQGVYHKE